MHHQPHGGADVAAPVLAQRTPAAPADVDPGQRPGSGIEAGREDDDVEIVAGAIRQLDPLGGDAGDRVVLHRHRLDIRAQVDFQVVHLQRHAVGAEAVVGRDQQLAEPRVLQPGAHLLAHEFGDLLADLGIEEHLAEGRQPQLERAVRVAVLKMRPALLGGKVIPLPVEVVFEAGEGVGQRLAQFLEPRLVGGDFLGAVGGVLHRQHVLRRADEDLQLGHLVGDGLDHLDAGGTDADHPDALARKVDALAGPARGMDDPALEAVLPGEDVGHGRGQHPAAGHQEPGVINLALVGGDGPAVPVLVEDGASDRGREADVAPQAEAVGDIAQPALDLGLPGEARAPGPVLVQVLREQILIDVSLGVELGAGIAVPVPGAAHVARRVEGPHLQAELAQLVQLVKPGHPGPDDQRVQHLLARRRLGLWRELGLQSHFVSSSWVGSPSPDSRPRAASVPWSTKGYETSSASS